MNTSDDFSDSDVVSNSIVGSNSHFTSDGDWLNDSHVLNDSDVPDRFFERALHRRRNDLTRDGDCCRLLRARRLDWRLASRLLFGSGLLDRKSVV